jgi:hypothetical protein
MLFKIQDTKRTIVIEQNNNSVLYRVYYLNISNKIFYISILLDLIKCLVTVISHLFIYINGDEIIF